MKERKYEELGTLMPDAGGVGMIPKTMIFVDNIDEAIAITVYLRKRLPARIRASKARTVVRSMSASLEPTTGFGFLEDCSRGNTRVWVCTDCSRMGLNFCGVACVVQWKIPEHVTFADLLQRLGRGGNSCCSAFNLVWSTPSDP